MFIRISSSRLKTLWDCALKHWYREVQNLPDRSHWKTRTGSVAHLLFEVIMHPRRLALFRTMMLDPALRLTSYPHLIRFTRWQLIRFEIADKVTVEDIAQLLDVALVGVRPYFVDVQGQWSPPSRWINEHRFQMTLPSGAVISGFIDLLLIWIGADGVTTRTIVIDLKSQAAKFTKAELPSNVQGAMYAMVTYWEFGIVPEVVFLMLRHAPTDKTPNKHLQILSPPSLLTLAGLEVYLESTYLQVNSMTFEEAATHCSQDEGYCQFKCSYLRPFQYWVVFDPVKDPEGKERPKSSYFTLDAATKAAQDGGLAVVERAFKGCSARWRG